MTYRRPEGVGLIYFYNSYSATASATDEFAKIWRERLGGTAPGDPPRPQLQRDGDFAAAVGTKVVDTDGTLTTITLTAIVGRGRALGVLTLSAGDEVFREVTKFLDTITFSAAGADATAAGEIDLDFTPPAGYTSQRDGRAIIIKPATMNDQTPCIYGISPSRPSSGNLERDARAAMLEPLPGWQLKGDRYNAMRGTSGDGWQYFWFRTDVQLPGPSYQYLVAMSMAIASAPGRASIIWGFGNPARCQLDDISFARLFHSLRPRGWSSDGGKTIARDLVGTWRNSQRVGMAQYKFLPNGRYEYGIGTMTRMGIFETTASSAHDGRYELRGGGLIITPSIRGRGASVYKVRIYDEFVTGRWTLAMSLLDESGRPGLDVQYMRVEP
jgi:hypothetical protein